LTGVVAMAGSADSPLVLATSDRICEIGAGGALGPCGAIGFRPVGLGSASSGAVFTADGNGTVAAFRPGRAGLVYSDSVVQGLAGPHGTLVSSRGRLYVPVQRGVAVVDPLGRRLLRVVKLPVTPTSIWVARFSGRLFAALYGVNQVAEIDTTRDVAATLLSGFTRPVSVWGSAGVAYVAGADGTLCRLDALTGKRLSCRRVLRPDARR
jgi:hypothetical protein